LLLLPERELERLREPELERPRLVCPRPREPLLDDELELLPRELLHTPGLSIRAEEMRDPHGSTRP
jgi:hypothetical protein